LPVVLALAAALRWLFPHADPPALLSGSGGLFFDEGAYTNNARNLYLFGSAFFDEWNSYWYSPVLHILQLPVFRVFGIGLHQERLIPMAMSVGTILLLCRYAARAWGRDAALYAAIFLGTGYFSVMYNRVGIVETPQAFFMMLAVVLWQSARRGNRWAAPASGMAAAMVVVSKSLGAYFVAAFFGIMALEALASAPGSRRAPWRRLLEALAGAAALMAAWYLLFFLPNRDGILRIGNAYKQLSVPRDLRQALANLRSNPFPGYYQPEIVPLLAALVAIGGLLLRAGRRSIVEHAEAWMLAAWIAGAALAVGLLSYRPNRYFVPLGPPIAALAAFGLASLGRGAGERDGAPFRPLNLAAAWLWLAVVFRLTLIDLFTRHWSLGPFSRWRLHWLLVAALATAAVALFRRGDRLPPAARAAMIVLVTTLALGHGLGQYRAWAADRRYTILETSREIAPLVDGGLLAGLASPALGLENETRVLYAFEPWFNYQDTFARFPITHLVLGVYNGEVDWYWRKYPEEMRRALPLRVYHLWRSDFYLFSMRPEDRGFFNRRPAAAPGPLDAAVVGFNAPGEISAGEAARGSITFRNTGSSAWEAGSALAIGSPRSRNPFGPNLLPATLAGAVRPGGEVTIPVTFNAPQRAGYFMTEYRLEDSRGQSFGDYVPIGILVR
jgi:4-amino-4-deoxy-L-arabinose transferase-like glycosyltransferase